MYQRLILFHRRLIMLIGCCIAVLLVLVLQLGWLTIVEGDEKLLKASIRLESTTYLPTWRGQIVDRKGRVLAHDVASYSIAIDWDVITGDRAIEYAREDARVSIGNERWKSISPEQRQEYISAYLPARHSELHDFWNIIATTGEIPRAELEKALDMIREEVEDTAHVVWERQEATHKEKYGDDVQFDAQPILEQLVPHVVLPHVTDEIAIAFELLSQRYDRVVHVKHARQRDYPNRDQTVFVDRSTLPSPMRKYDSIELSIDNVAKLIVGDVRHDVWAEDIQKKPFVSGGELDLSGYRVGDEVGKRGLEKSLELSLRGARGKVVRHRSGDEISRIPVEGGEEIHMTLDIALQARVQAVLSQELGLMVVQDWHRNANRNAILPIGTPLRGAVVVLDIETNEILAMASTPALRDGIDVDGYPWLNRAADGLYPPGSIIKPLVLAAAMTEGLLLPDESIECVGHYFEHVTDVARCWIYRSKYNNRTHGHLKTVEAIARSCNIFFYELGTRLGFDQLISWLERFGMSQPLSALMTDENAVGTQGHLPDVEDIKSLHNRGAMAFETVSVAIGQGALTWSPLHAASAYATLARGGYWYPPSLVKGMNHVRTDLKLNPNAVSLALSGLRDSVAQKYGTGSRIRFDSNRDEPTFNVNGIRIWGKTGTAEAPPYMLKKDSTGIEGLDHSWFLVMASPMAETMPTIVVAVLVEHGGSGGRVAGPIANQILHAIQIEGYLGGER